MHTFELYSYSASTCSFKEPSVQYDEEERIGKPAGLFVDDFKPCRGSGEEKIDGLSQLGRFCAL